MEFRTQEPTGARPHEERRHKSAAAWALVVATCSVAACKGGGSAGGGGSSVGGELFAKPKPLRTKVIDDKLLARALGEYVPKEKPDGEYYKVTIAADKIRCNHSNHSDEYTSHPYAVAYAQDGTVRLNAAAGSLIIKVDDAGDKFTFDGNGICPWGIDNPYKQVKPLEGKPAELLDPQTPEKRDAETGKVGEELKLPHGTINLSEVKRSTWEGKDGDTPVVELKVSVTAPENTMVDPFLAGDIADIASTEKEVWSVSCEGADSKGTGNPSFKDHREPKFDTGIYTGWGGHRETVVKGGKSRSGWIVMLMNKKANGKCTIKYDAVGLGGGMVSWTHTFE